MCFVLKYDGWYSCGTGRVMWGCVPRWRSAPSKSGATTRRVRLFRLGAAYSSSGDDPERDRTLSRMGFAQAYSVAPCAKPVANDVYDVGCVISSIPVSIPP